MNDFPWEDNLIERKLESDLKDVLKTLVGFANSVKPGHVATLLIGEKDDGSIQGVTNPDKIQQTIRSECDKIYPPILWKSLAYEIEGKHCVKVEVEYSGETPHFGGAAWIRKGSETIKATEEIFQRLIELRNGKVFELAKWFDKEVTICLDETSPTHIGVSAGGISTFGNAPHRWPTNDIMANLIFLNNFWVTLKRNDNNENQSESLDKLRLSFDDKNNRLKIIVYY